jgi:prolactin regulatory element-binding protein
VHEFPPTTLHFNPSSTLLVSGSADNSIRVVSVPDSLGDACTSAVFFSLSNVANDSTVAWNLIIFIVITLLVILLAIAAQLLLS